MAVVQPPAFNDGAAAAAAVAARDSAQTLKEQIVNLVGGTGIVPTYPSYVPNKTVSGVSAAILPGDPDRLGIEIQCKDETVDLAINFAGGAADFASSSSVTQYGGDCVYYDACGTGPISIVGRRVDPTDKRPISGLLFLKVRRLTPAPSPDLTLGDLVMSAWADPVDSRLRAAVRTAINGLEADGNYAKIRGFWLLRGASASNNSINLAAPRGPTASYVGSVTVTPYAHTKGDGVAAKMRTGLTGAQLGFGTNLSTHFLAVKPATNAIDAGIAMGISSSLALQPNRSATTAGYRSVGTEDVRTGATPGKWIAESRMSDTQYLQFEDADLVATVTKAATAITDRELNLLAINGSNGIAAPSALPLEMALAGVGITAAEWTQIYNRVNPIRAVCDTIVASGVQV